MPLNISLRANIPPHVNLLLSIIYPKGIKWLNCLKNLSLTEFFFLFKVYFSSKMGLTKALEKDAKRKFDNRNAREHVFCGCLKFTITFTIFNYFR